MIKTPEYNTRFYGKFRCIIWTILRFFTFKGKASQPSTEFRLNKDTSETSKDKSKKNDSKSGTSSPSRQNSNKNDQNQSMTDVQNKNYDTVTSVNDIEQDDYNNYYDEEKKSKQQLYPLNRLTNTTLPTTAYERTLTNIVEVPSKNITRNNSASDVEALANSKV